MKIGGTNGWLAVDYLVGEVHQLVFSAPDLSYDYLPPVDLPFDQQMRFKILRREEPEDFVFDAEVVVVDCDKLTCQEFLDKSFSGVEDSTLSAFDPELRKFLKESADDQKEARRDSAFSGFRRPLRPEQRQYSIRVKKNERDHWNALYFDNETAWEIVFASSGYGRLYGYDSKETRESGMSLYDLDMRPDGGASRDYDVKGLRGTVELALDGAELLKADVRFTMKTKRELREIPFRLGNLNRPGSARSRDRNPSISVDRLQFADGTDLMWARFGGSSGLIILPEAVPAGTELVIDMEFQNEGSIKRETSAYAYLDRSGWLPFVQFTDRIEEFELTVKAPARFKIIGVGRQVSSSTQSGVTTTTWSSDYPVTFPTVIFGDYFVDSPKIEALKSDGTEIPVTVHIDNDSFSSWGLRPRSARPIGEQAVNAINLFTEIFGVEYPYDKLDLINDSSGLGAQAPASIIYVGSLTFRGEGTLAGLGNDSRYITHFARTTVPHEVGHQWWGSRVANANQRNYWFVESLAEYSSALFTEAVGADGGKNPEKGFQEYLAHVDIWRKLILESDLQASVEDAPVLWTNGEYIPAVYSKGPYAFHILRMTFGDEKFFAFLKKLATELQGKNVITRDIQAVAEESFGGTMEWFFDQWIRGVGIPEYSFNYKYRKAEDNTYVIEGTIDQRVVLGSRKDELDGVFYRGVVPITVKGKDKQTYTKRLIVEAQPTTSFGFKVPVEPDIIVLNELGEILAHPVLENRSW